jgi:hypothetical protein
MFVMMIEMLFVLNRSMVSLQLNDNCLNDAAAVTLAIKLSSDKQLTHLNISNNKVKHIT